MSEPTSYDGLSLEDIMEITAADAANSGAIKDQAHEARRLATQLSEAQKSFEHAFGRINGSIEDQAQPVAGDRLMRSAFAGETADATKNQTVTLFWTTGAGRVGIEAQPRVFEELGHTVTSTHTAMAGIKSERDQWIDLLATDPDDPQLQAKYGPGADPAALKTAINADYDGQARDHMQSVANGYLALVNELPEVQVYQGPRAPGPDESGGEDGGGYRNHASGGDGDTSRGDNLHSRPGPSLSRYSGGTTHTTSDPGRATPYSPVEFPDYRSGPDLQSGLPQTVTPTPNIPSGPAVPTGPGPGNPFIPNPQVIPPVIGSRGPTGGIRQSTSPGNNALRPASRGLVRPVIGERIGKFNTVETGRGATARATPPPNSSRGANRSASKTGGSRPVLGRSRQAGTRGAAKPAPVRLKQNSVPKPTKTFGSTRAGVRAAPRPPQETTGRVIGRRAGQQPSAPKTVVQREFGRAPKSLHGGQDGLNRPVVRNSRALTSAPEATTKPAAARRDREPETTANEWFDTSKLVPPVIRGHRPVEDVDHDPGDFITRYNLGRNRLG